MFLAVNSFLLLIDICRMITLKEFILFDAIFFLSTFVGLIWLSPDIDSFQSRPFKRWLFLKYFWYPYSARKHRGISHILILGDLDRVLYMVLVYCILKASKYVVLEFIIVVKFIYLYWQYSLIAFSGIVFASLLHRVMDKQSDKITLVRKNIRETKRRTKKA